MSAEIDLGELQGRLLYAIIVAGKSAKFTDAVMRRMYEEANDRTLFELIRDLITAGTLAQRLKEWRTGNYQKVEKAFRQVVDLKIDLRTCTPEQLEVVHGIGPKTARFFILWTQPGANYAALDVHVLRWMRGLGYSAPRSTPTGAHYRRLERLFLQEAKQRGLTPRELDSKIWEAGAKYQ